MRNRIVVDCEPDISLNITAQLKALVFLAFWFLFLNFSVISNRNSLKITSLSQSIEAVS